MQKGYSEHRTTYKTLVNTRSAVDLPNAIYSEMINSSFKTKIPKQPSIFFVFGNQTAKHFKQNILSIGRAPSCSIRCVHVNVSRVQCFILHFGNELCIVDLWSKLGTIVKSETENTKATYNGIRVPINKKISIYAGNILIATVKGY